MLRYDPFPIFSRHIPLGGLADLVALRVTGDPLKQGEESPDDPPRAVQKSGCDCQMSVNLVAVEFVGVVARPCNEAAKGELKMDTFWQVDHTCEQKLFEADCVEFGDTVELHSTGRFRRTEATLNSSDENGSHLCHCHFVNSFLDQMLILETIICSFLLVSKLILQAV